MADIRPGWYYDPERPGHVAHWNGQRLGDERHPAPVDYVDPAGVRHPQANDESATTARRHSRTDGGPSKAAPAGGVEPKGPQPPRRPTSRRRLLGGAAAVAGVAAAALLAGSSGGGLCSTVAALPSQQVNRHLTANDVDLQQAAEMHEALAHWHDELAQQAGEVGQIATRTAGQYEQAAADLRGGTTRSSALTSVDQALSRPDLGLGAQLHDRVTSECGRDGLAPLRRLR